MGPSCGQTVVETPTHDERYVRDSFRRAGDMENRRLRRALPAELGGRRAQRDPDSALREAACAALQHLRNAGLLGELSERVLADDWHAT